MEPASKFETTPPVAPARKGGAKKLVLAVIVGVAVVSAAVFAYLGYTHPAVYMVNASSAKTLTFFVDDKQVAQLSPALTESEAQAGSASTHVAAGEHTFSAKDESGKVVDSQKLKVEAGTPSLYAPLHSDKVCWTLQTDAYGDVHVARPLIPLDPSRSFWQLVPSPDFWFQNTPDKIETDSKSKGEKKTALRQHACGDSEFAADGE